MSPCSIVRKIIRHKQINSKQSLKFYCTVGNIFGSLNMPSAVRFQCSCVLTNRAVVWVCIDLSKRTGSANIFMCCLDCRKVAIEHWSYCSLYKQYGIDEKVWDFEEISDARAIRTRILYNFELSMAPGIAKEEIDRLLHTVIVGGGPTGVEFGAELYDFIRQV